MDALYKRHEFGQIAGRVGWHVVFMAQEVESLSEASKNLVRMKGKVAAAKDVQRRGLLKRPSSRGFYLRGALCRRIACHDYCEIYVDGAKKAVSFN